MFPVFFFSCILGLLDCKGLLNWYHMLSLCAAVIDLMWVCCFPDSVCGECVWEREEKRQIHSHKERGRKKECVCLLSLELFSNVSNAKSLIQYISLLNCIINYLFTVSIYLTQQHGCIETIRKREKLKYNSKFWSIYLLQWHESRSGEAGRDGSVYSENLPQWPAGEIK